ncbi:hypothetical protein PtB15_8B363 [Puccinia triticina]|nr:hypothetical protein PtB15_8B363 [Puccinia triticina]
MCFPTLISFQLPANTPANRDSHKKHVYHGNIGDNISDPSCSGTSSEAATEDSDSSEAATEDSDNGDGESEPESGSDASEYEAPGCPPSPPNHSEPIKIRLQMNQTQPPQLNPTPQTIAGSALAPPITKSKKFLPGRWPRPTKARPVQSTPLFCPKTPVYTTGQANVLAKKPAGKRGRPKKDPADASNVTFQSAPLTDADWERITARSAANWSAHWKSENEKIRLQNIGQVRECPLVEVGPGPGLITSKSVNTAATQRLSQRSETAQKDAPSQKLLAAKKTKAPTQPKVGMRRSS